MKFKDIKVGKRYNDTNPNIGTLNKYSWEVLYKDSKGLLVEYESGRRYTMPPDYNYSTWKEVPQKIKRFVYCTTSLTFNGLPVTYITFVYDSYKEASDSRDKYLPFLTTEIKEVVFDVP